MVTEGKIIIITTKSLINSAALKKLRRAAGMSFSAAEQVCLQVSCKSCHWQWRKTQVSSTQLVGCSKCLDGKQQSSFDR